MMVATSCDNKWNVFNIQHITPNSKRWDYSDILVGGTKNIIGLAHMVEGDHHLRTRGLSAYIARWLLEMPGVMTDFVIMIL